MCASPCGENWEENPCGNIANSTGDCFALSIDRYYCGCHNGRWNNGECMPAEQSKALTLGNICTGQKKCYDGTFNYSDYTLNTMNCPAPGENLYGQEAQYAALGACTQPNYSINTDVQNENIVVDNNTLLQWQQNISSEKFTWNEAYLYCLDLQYGGFDDWRLPRPQEIMTLPRNIEFAPYSTSVWKISFDDRYFSPNNALWTVDNYNQSYSTNAPLIYLDFTVQIMPKETQASVICVRGDVLQMASFSTKTAANGDEYVVDYATGLAWYNTNTSTQTINVALSHCENLDYAGETDWRLPNFNEITALSNYGSYSPRTNFPNISQSLALYWNSTIFLNLNYYNFYIFCVRNLCPEGQIWRNDTCFSPCGTDSCDSSSSFCVATTPETYRCECKEGFFPTGSNYCSNPCERVNCSSDPHSNGECLVIDANNYSCGCEDGFFWDGASCVSPCEGSNPCSGKQHSNGKCTATGVTTFSCGCDDGYWWWDNSSTCTNKKPLYLGNICTGQDKCFSDEEEISCPASGEDFYGQDAQYAAYGFCKPQSFSILTRNGDKIVFDNNTGLQWQQNFPTSRMNWEKAVEYCKNLEYGVYGDWRLPNGIEFFLMNPGHFPNIQSDTIFWNLQDYPEYINSNTSSYGNYSLIFSPANNGSAIKTKTDSYNAVCVRGREIPTVELTPKTINGETILTDPATNLVWQENPTALSNWKDALAYCENLTYAGYADWRLPNRNEASVYPSYATSTTATTIQNYVALMSGNAGYIKNFTNGQTFNVRCVRSDFCGNNEFWNGETCATSPCKANTCNTSHSTGLCIPQTETKYMCECDDKSFWNGSACVNPCDSHPCTGLHKTGFCEPENAEKYFCGCDEGYTYNQLTDICSDEIPAAFGRICTGIESCYNASSSGCPVVDEDFYGQDAQYAELGLCLRKSFSIRESGIENERTIFDNNLKLEWQETIPDETSNWENANTYCNELEYAGYDDWRLPIQTEVLSISGAEKFFGDEKTYCHYPISTCYVRCVRGETLPNAYFELSTENGNEIVTDSTSGLIWQKQISEEYTTWKEALEYCKNSTYAGYADWRVPNRNELASLINYNFSYPATEFPNEEMSSYFWTSSYNTSDNVWGIDLSGNNMGYVNTSSLNYANGRIICVRTLSKCSEGFIWNGTKCETAPTRKVSCENLPANAVWNSVSSITQTWNGLDKWYPNKKESFGKDPSTTTCRFKCNSGYEWTGSECVPPYEDEETGLLWSTKTLNNVSWQEAVDYCENLDFGGFTDWRLPSINELRTIIRNCPNTESTGLCGLTDDCLDTACEAVNSCDCDYLPNNEGHYSKLGDDSNVFLWSSSEIANYPDFAWGIDFAQAYVSGRHKNDHSYGYYARCVR